MNVGSQPVSLIGDRVALDRHSLQELHRRLSRTRLPTRGLTTWEQGVPPTWLSRLLEDWATFDVDGLQHQLDELTHLRADVDDQRLHLLHAPGVGPNPVPLLLCHGWPGSFLEHLRLLPLLTHPPADPRRQQRPFTVVALSLPGSGFSGPAVRDVPVVSETVCHQAVEQLCDIAACHAVRGWSDLGAGATSWLARDHPESVAAIHLATPGLVVPAGLRNPEEEAFAAASEAWTADEGAYAHQHATKPGTLSIALSDNPAGLAAWIGEKIIAWSRTNPDGSPAFDRNLLLATLTLYWTTGTIRTSLLPYWALRHAPEGALPTDDPCPGPTAVTIFGGEQVPFPKPPRSLTERYYNLTAWAVHPDGGHFPAVATPALLATILRRTLQSAGI